ncbi:Minor extracellular protease Epr [Trichoderma lentiforme]|uniref:Minor extracellular protease Epr n=1 Tax=Trichoderma lentiforme TaxID=1567552 RepID=A0A9P5CB87_9HYPO|nr:Minor extracellular protease Epr [Trichoderma lentiforme]
MSVETQTRIRDLYGKYEGGAKKTDGPAVPKSRESQASSENPVQKLLRLISEEDWKLDTSKHLEIKAHIMATEDFGIYGDKLLLQLISQVHPNPLNWEDSIWMNGKGRSFLYWMLRDEDLKGQFENPPEDGERGADKLSEKLPIHLAIDKENLSFLTCFLGLYHEAKFGEDSSRAVFLEQLDRALEAKDKAGNNAVHLAMANCLPFVPFMVAACSAKALKDTDSAGQTPLHCAFRMRLSSSALATAIPPQPNIAYKKPENGNESYIPIWDKVFDPCRVLQEIKQRADAKEILPSILTTINKSGYSPYQEKFDKYDSRKDSGRKAMSIDLKSEMKNLIFENVKGIPNVSKALYGSSGNVKELCLDMSDFNQTSHNFEKFVEKLTTLDGNGDEGIGMDMIEDETTLQFENILFFVHLPDLNYVKQPLPHQVLKKLFLWLRDRKGVQTIKRLNVPDCTTNPINPAFFRLTILNHFVIEELDWRILDMNLDILTQKVAGRSFQNSHAKESSKTVNTGDHLKKLTLYSSGNWGVLHHWISKDGLATLPKLTSVQIEIVTLDPADGLHDQSTRASYLKMATAYKDHLETWHSKMKEDYNMNRDRYRSEGLNFGYELKVNIEAKWYYPPPPHEPEEPTAHVPKHQFTGQLGPCQKFLDDLTRVILDEKKQGNIDNGKLYTASSKGSTYETIEDSPHYVRRFQQYALRKNLKCIDERIKVAVIDNGADRIRSIVGEMIAKGVSYVTADLADQSNSDRILPWWMVSDAHGTQMASLIGQTNPYCRLYIARVGKGRDNIDPKNAAKAIRWALDQNVDIISMSWTTKKDETELRDAIVDASKPKSNKRPTLIFCSTADEGVSSEAIYPADYEKNVVKVSATDRWGQLSAMSRSAKPADIQIPGENIEAVGPAYIGSVFPTVSGSSVATALAAGIASLALLLLRTYNDLDERQVKEIYSKEGILKIFKKMEADKAGIQLHKLFPREITNETKEQLAKDWKGANFQFI